VSAVPPARVTAGTEVRGPVQGLDRLAAADGGRPVLTQYAGVPPTRVELSRVTTAGWVAKTANLLLDEVGLAAGDQAALLLPLHWQTVVCLLACWRVGVITSVLPQGAVPDGVSAVFAAADRLAGVSTDVPGAELVGLSLHPLGAPLGPGAPAGVLDYAALVPGCADAPPPLVGPDLPVHRLAAGRVASGAELAERGAAWASDRRLAAGDRLLTVLDLSAPDGLEAAVLAPLAVGAGVVLTGTGAEAPLAGWAAQEGVTATAGVSLPGVRRLV
jgi:uncharacterized protein (TIGR03089 family)